MAKTSNAGTERKMGRKGRDKSVPNGNIVEEKVRNGESDAHSNDAGFVVEQDIELHVLETSSVNEPTESTDNNTIILESESETPDSTLTVTSWRVQGRQITVFGKMHGNKRFKAGQKLRSPKAVWLIQSIDTLTTHDTVIIMAFVRGKPDLSKGISLSRS